MKKRNGFSAMEVLIVVGLMGLMAAIVTPIFIGVRAGMAKKTAMTTATAIDTAVFAYKQDNRTAAATAYAAAADKYALLKTAGYLNGAPATLAAASTDGYTFTMPATLVGTTVVNKDGQAVPRE
jgi:prepilin-type N-terminal cleavage/methylation domain-containing protein